jgi:hypothetical protein
MRGSVQRRSLLIGGGVAAIALVAGGATAARLLVVDSSSPEAQDAAYAKLLAEVRDDYVNGRVVEHQGWVLSQHEFDTLASREKRPAKPVAAS